jgi:hypothetical protein
LRTPHKFVPRRGTLLEGGRPTFNIACHKGFFHYRTAGYRHIGTYGAECLLGMSTIGSIPVRIHLNTFFCSCIARIFANLESFSPSYRRSLTMAAITFDTFKFMRRLMDAGIPENQDEAISEAIQETHATQWSEMAAKRDLKELEGQLSTKADMAKVEVQVLELKRDIKELELRIAADMAKIHGELATARWGIAIIVGLVIALILKSFVRS